MAAAIKCHLFRDGFSRLFRVYHNNIRLHLQTNGYSNVVQSQCLRKAYMACLCNQPNTERGHHITASSTPSLPPFTSQRYGSTVSHKEQTIHDVHKLIDTELSSLPALICNEIRTTQPELRSMAQYYFDGRGKSFRPMVIMLMALTCNHHTSRSRELLDLQRRVAMIGEMIHTASLLHDDIIDKSDTRRGKASANALWGQRKCPELILVHSATADLCAVYSRSHIALSGQKVLDIYPMLAGDYILSEAGVALARLNSTEVVTIITEIIDDLVRGEFMQLSHKDNENERFAHYLRKTFRKTASLLANSCKAAAVLGDCSPEVTTIAYEFGRNLGIAHQLIDDVLDFTSTDTSMGKPVAADLRLGLATAPALFASQQYPELNAMIMRGFSQDGDVEMARLLVDKSNGIQETRFMAEKYCEEAANQISSLDDSPPRKVLLELTKNVLSRKK